ncbi:RagB/SusD family nutrient uptake outer membrane protein [Chitinophaga niabensis]|uniref:Starch-binding associating with outer membrane n=1 Tax=Chitinophaga niabensis TaxID=536979 RepID=A0A1N6IY34_9BACT|nr:RagB/SusD family nutrient uptake outer membrane protein [Chitinophaga niabensis]SIO36960.1 Starch-binding associating with outer membrane [Chitinophaga niabensis]
MKNIIFLILSVLLITASCKRILDETPQGVVSDNDLNTPENVNKLVIAAYSSLGNDHYTSPYTSLWPYGSVRGGDAYKGGDGPGDITEFHLLETFSLNRADNGLTDELWFRLYVGIARANDALRRVNAIDEAVFPDKKKRQGELRFLRGHFYFLLKILFKYVPYIDENAPKNVYDTISNKTYSNDALWTKIADDFRAAVANLPETQPEAGRANQLSAKAYLAKTLLYQAYIQDETNNVTSINTALLTEANKLCDDIIISGKYIPNADYGNNFLTPFENSKESVFAIQYSKDDGTPKGRLDYGHALNYPMNTEFGCCGFHVPSHDLINAFKTDANGLPLFDTYNNTDVAESGDYMTSSFDPRLSHTVAIPGKPFKYKTNFIFLRSWARAPEVYDAFASLKEAVAPDDPSFQKIPPFMSSSKNWDVIRYADVLLFKAEALIELGRQNEALTLINDLRTRSGNSTARLKQADGTPSANYKIATYQPGINCTWTQAFARQALRWERRLEFATEGYHFFDLVRWGIAAEYINKYFTVEKTRSAHLNDAFFKKNRDEYLPIPLNQINYSRGLYQQNAGW